MKRTYLLMLIAVLLLGFTACEKEGVYNPKEKISRIFFESTYTDGRELDESWDWNDNLLTKITSYPGGSFYDFSYDGKRLEKIQHSSGDRYELFYDGNKLSKMEIYGSTNTLEEIYTFEHEGSKITKIISTEYDKSISSQRPIFTLLFGDIIGKDLANTVAKREKVYIEKGIKSSYTYSMTFEWENDNVIKRVYEETYNGEYYSETAEIQYDNKLNPYYHSLWELYWANIPQSKNNITKVVYSASDGDYGENSYSYTYDGNFPIERKYYYGSYYSIYYYDYE